MKDLWRLPYEERRAITHRIPAIGSKWRRGGTAKTDVGRARRATVYTVTEILHAYRVYLKAPGQCFQVSIQTLNLEWAQVDEPTDPSGSTCFGDEG